MEDATLRTWASFPIPTVLLDSRLVAAAVGRTQKAERPRTTPYDLSPSQEKGLKGSNRWPKGGGEQEVYILER